MAMIKYGYNFNANHCYQLACDYYYYTLLKLLSPYIYLSLLLYNDCNMTVLLEYNILNKYTDIMLNALVFCVCLICLSDATSCMSLCTYTYTQDLSLCYNHYRGINHGIFMSY